MSIPPSTPLNSILKTGQSTAYEKPKKVVSFLNAVTYLCDKADNTVINGLPVRHSSELTDNSQDHITHPCEQTQTMFEGCSSTVPDPNPRGKRAISELANMQQLHAAEEEAMSLGQLISLEHHSFDSWVNDQNNKKSARFDFLITQAKPEAKTPEEQSALLKQYVANRFVLAGLNSDGKKVNVDVLTELESGKLDSKKRQELSSALNRFMDNWKNSVDAQISLLNTKYGLIDRQDKAAALLAVMPIKQMNDEGLTSALVRLQKVALNKTKSPQHVTYKTLTFENLVSLAKYDTYEPSEEEELTDNYDRPFQHRVYLHDTRRLAYALEDERANCLSLMAGQSETNSAIVNSTVQQPEPEIQPEPETQLEPQALVRVSVEASPPAPEATAQTPLRFHAAFDTAMQTGRARFDYLQSQLPSRKRATAPQQNADSHSDLAALRFLVGGLNSRGEKIALDARTKISMQRDFPNFSPLYPQIKREEILKHHLAELSKSGEHILNSIQPDWSAQSKASAFLAGMPIHTMNDQFLKTLQAQQTSNLGENNPAPAFTALVNLAKGESDNNEGGLAALRLLEQNIHALREQNVIESKGFYSLTEIPEQLANYSENEAKIANIRQQTFSDNLLSVAAKKMFGKNKNQRVLNELSSHPQVFSYRPAKFSEGVFATTVNKLFQAFSTKAKAIKPASRE